MCELVYVCIINVLFINITMRSKFCSYLCILSRDHYIHMCIYIIYILLSGIKYLIIVNFCCITFLALKLITPYVSFLILALMYLFIYFVLRNVVTIYSNLHGICYIV